LAITILGGFVGRIGACRFGGGLFRLPTSLAIIMPFLLSTSTFITRASLANFIGFLRSSPSHLLPVL
jgi:hypothetical protein